MAAFLRRLAAAQHARPYSWVLGWYVLAALSLPLVRQLEIKTGFEQLLPRHKQSIEDVEAARGRIGGLTTLTVAIQSRSRPAMQAFAKELVPRLLALQSLGVRSVDWNIRAYEDFVHDHRQLYAELSDLQELRDALQERVDYEKLRKNPLYVRLDDEPPPDPQQLLDELRAKADQGKDKLKKYEGGYFLHPQRDLLAVFLRTDLKTGDAASAGRLIDAVRARVQALGPSRYAPDLRIEYAGDLVSVREEHDAIATEMVIATGLTIVLVLFVIVLFFKRLRALPLLGLTITAPVLVTYGIAELTVGSLNTSTAFLASIIIGNGINPAVIWLARYQEARRAGQSVGAALQTGHADTWKGTLAAAVAAGVSYASLILTDFRGFHDFGVISCVGMLVCWLASVSLLPPLCVLSERYKPMARGDGTERVGPYGRLLWRLGSRAPRAVLVGAAASALACAYLLAAAIAADPIEYDFRKLRSERETASRSSTLNRWVGEIVGRAGSGASIAMLVPERGDATTVRQRLDHAREHDGAPYGRVRTIDDLLPKEQPKKLQVLAEIRALMLEARAYADPEQQRKLDENLPAENLTALTEADLPEATARPYAERDGTRGRILFVEQRDGESTWDGRYLIKWAAALRRAELPSGERPRLLGNAPVFADILEVIWHDGPKAVALALSATIVLVWFSFRALRPRVLTLGALLLGVLWLCGLLSLLKVKLNFLNFVSFPITFGNGVDYAVNVMGRHELEASHGDRREAVRKAVEECGGAVALNSLTTIIGYASLHVSANQALRSFGLAMTLSEAVCLTAAVVVLPAYLLVRLAHQKR